MKRILAFMAVCGLAGLVGACETAGTDDAATATEDRTVEAVSASATTELSVRVGETTMWVHPGLARATRNGREMLVLTGRTSRNVVSGAARDGLTAGGTWAKTGIRTFEATWGTDGAAALLAGAPALLDVTMLPSKGRPDTLTGRVVARPMLASTAAATASLSQDVTPIATTAGTVFRVHGQATGKVTALTLKIGVEPVASVASGKTFQADLSEDQVTRLIGKGAAVVANLKVSGKAAVVQGQLVLRLGSFGVTDEDPAATWPGTPDTVALKGLLEQASAGLLYGSESDYPYVVFVIPGGWKAPVTAATVKTVLAPIYVPRAESMALADRTVQASTLDGILGRYVTPADWWGDAEKAQADRYQQFIDVLSQGLIGASAFRVGPADPFNGLSPDIDVFVIGGTPNGDLVGVWTVSIET